MQIFVLLYIEGGSYIDEEDDRWEFVTLYVSVLTRRIQAANPVTNAILPTFDFQVREKKN